MSEKRPPATTVALVVSVLYGLTVGLLAVLDVPAMGTVAVVGGLVLGAMWAVIAIVARRPRRAG